MAATNSIRSQLEMALRESRERKFSAMIETLKTDIRTKEISKVWFHHGLNTVDGPVFLARLQAENIPASILEPPCCDERICLQFDLGTIWSEMTTEPAGKKILPTESESLRFVIAVVSESETEIGTIMDALAKRKIEAAKFVSENMIPGVEFSYPSDQSSSKILFAYPCSNSGGFELFSISYDSLEEGKEIYSALFQLGLNPILSSDQKEVQFDLTDL